jgi:hypothetical protein
MEFFVSTVMPDGMVRAVGLHVGSVSPESIVGAPVFQHARTVIMENIVISMGLDHAHLVRRASTRTVRVGLVRILVEIVMQENTLQQAQDFAHPVLLESIQV